MSYSFSLNVVARVSLEITLGSKLNRSHAITSHSGVCWREVAFLN
jgi:hypothetical protein